MSRPVFEILLDKPYQIRFTASAIAWFEDQYGSGVVRAVAQNAGVKVVAALLAAGVRGAGDRKMTVEKMLLVMDEWLDQGHGLIPLTKEVVRALKEQGIFDNDDEDPNPGARGDSA